MQFKITSAAVRIFRRQFPDFADASDYAIRRIMTAVIYRPKHSKLIDSAVIYYGNLVDKAKSEIAIVMRPCRDDPNQFYTFRVSNLSQEPNNAS